MKPNISNEDAKYLAEYLADSPSHPTPTAKLLAQDLVAARADLQRLEEQGYAIVTPLDGECLGDTLLRESKHVERAIDHFFRWGCCDKNIDQKPCEPNCIRKRMIELLKDWRKEQNAASAKFGGKPLYRCLEPGCGETSYAVGEEVPTCIHNDDTGAGQRVPMVLVKAQVAP